MDRLAGKHVVVGVGASIAAYKACDVVRGLRAEGATVRVAPTKAAGAFVTPLTFEALSGRPPLTTSLDMEDGRIPHVEEAYAAALVVVAPASADLLAKMAHGFADEAVLSLLLSYEGPLVVAPAMETRMWRHPATQANVATLRARGAVLVGPERGPLASGRDGEGRLAAPEAILAAARAAVAPQDLADRRVVLTAGPTVEDVDPVRYLTNRSSGKMGAAVAEALAERGAVVDVVHGPMRAALPPLAGVRAHPVRSARQMYEAVHRLLDDGARVDAVVLAAAVADFAPSVAADRKIKKSAGGLASIELVPTDDVLASVGARADRPVLVGFAAETHDVVKYAREKLLKKGCDLICANDVSAPDAGFDVDTNRVVLVRKDGESSLPLLSKRAAADKIVDEVATLLRSRRDS